MVVAARKIWKRRRCFVKGIIVLISLANILIFRLEIRLLFCFALLFNISNYRWYQGYKRLWKVMYKK